MAQPTIYMQKQQTTNMKKIALLFIVLASFAFTTQQQKEVTVKLTVAEWQYIFNKLGDFPAKETEGMRTKIANQVNSQLTDTIGKK
jgi:hypothetical protein